MVYLQSGHIEYIKALVIGKTIYTMIKKAIGENKKINVQIEYIKMNNYISS